MAGSQNARVLAALADREWHTVPEIHARAGTMRLNSRVAELRSKGYEIECRTVAGRRGADRYEYRLLSEPGSTELASFARADVAGDTGRQTHVRSGSESSAHILGAPIAPERAPTPAPVDPLSAGAGLQLTLEAVA